MSSPLIKILVLLLLVQVISPLCHATGHTPPHILDTLITTVSPSPHTPAAPILIKPATTPEAEPCWFTGAHIFESADTSAPLPTFVTLAVLTILIVLGFVAPDKTWFPHPWKTPDRPPPTQALLQVFLN